MKYKIKPLPISKWNEPDTPSYKIKNTGISSLTNTELISVILGKECSMLVIQNILHDVNNSLKELNKLSYLELSKYHGIAKEKSYRIKAALELGARMFLENSIQTEKLIKSSDAYTILKQCINGSPYESFWVLCLNRQNKIIHKECINNGGIDFSLVDPRKVFKIALDHYATSIILGHNHPSDNCKPSKSDEKITEQLVNAGKFLNITVVDHMIVCDDSYFSFADNGLL